MRKVHLIEPDLAVWAHKNRLLHPCIAFNYNVTICGRRLRRILVNSFTNDLKKVTCKNCLRVMNKKEK